MGVKYEVTAITGKYTNKSGEEKNRYTKVGVIVETKNGPMLKLESVPLQWDGWAYLNEPKTQEERQQSKGGSVGDMESDIPFANPLRGRHAYIA
jgi:hypothetical protein